MKPANYLRRLATALLWLLGMPRPHSRPDPHGDRDALAAWLLKS